MQPFCGKADTAVGQELGGFDLADGRFDQLAKLLTLFVGDRGAEVLNLDHAFADEDHQGHFGDARDPGVADQLRIESQQSLGLFGIASRRGLPFEQAVGAVQVTYRIDVGDEVIAVGKRTVELDLHVSVGLANADAVVLANRSSS